MRLLKAIINDIKFQFKYGFYLLYLIVTIIYVAVITFLPPQYKGLAVAIVLFSDLAALGLVFMGAIVLFEKSERVLNSIFISPLTIDEYILAKVFSLSIISTLAGFCIALATALTEIRVFPLFLGLMAVIIWITLFWIWTRDNIRKMINSLGGLSYEGNYYNL